MYRTIAQLFRDRGFDATSVSDIARALGLTKAGLYHHFESKEALLFEIMMFGLDKVRDEVILPVRAIRDPEERLRQLITRHARITTRGQGAVAHLQDEIRALPPPARKQVEQRMRVYFDLVRGTLDELHAAGRLCDVDRDRRDVQPDWDDSVAAAMVPAGRPAHAGTGRGEHRQPRARRSSSSAARVRISRPGASSALDPGSLKGTCGAGVATSMLS